MTEEAAILTQEATRLANQATELAARTAELETQQLTQLEAEQLTTDQAARLSQETATREAINTSVPEATPAPETIKQSTAIAMPADYNLMITALLGAVATFLFLLLFRKKRELLLYTCVNLQDPQGD